MKKLTFTNWGVLLLIILLPFGFALNPTNNIDLSIVRILIPFLFLIWLAEGFLKNNLTIDTRPRACLLLFIFVLAFISLFWSVNTSKAIRKFLFLASIFPVYWVFFAYFKNKLNFEYFLKVFFITALITALIGIFQFASQFIVGLDVLFKAQSKITPFFLGQNFSEMVLTYNSWLVNINGKTLFRAIGLFPDPHLFSLFLNIALPVGWFLTNKKKNRGFYLVGFLIILTASFLSFSRAGYLSLIGLFLIFWLHFLKQKNIWNILLGLFFIAFLAIPNPVNQRLFSSLNFQDGSVKERLDLMKTGIEITKNNFWGGVGIGNLSETIQPLSDQRTPIYAHNLFLDFSSELGVAGGLALFILIILPILNFFKNSTSKNRLIMLVFVVFFIHSMFETPFYSVSLLPLILAFLTLEQ
jgi:O-antigen ligase